MLTFLSKLYASLKARFEPSVDKVTAEFQAIVKKLEGVADFHALKSEAQAKLQADAAAAKAAADAELAKAQAAAAKIKSLLS